MKMSDVIHNNFCNEIWIFEFNSQRTPILSTAAHDDHSGNFLSLSCYSKETNMRPWPPSVMFLHSL